VKLQVVIPALDEADRIAGAVASAIADGIDGVEVVVVDGGSRDDTADRAAAAGARIVRSERGRARQLQVGVEATSGDTLLMLHADTRLAPGWFGAIERALQDPEVVGGAFRFQFSERDGDRGERAALRFVEWGARQRSERLGLPYGDQALFVRRSALAEVGGIPQVPIMEDLDLVVALRRRGELAVLDLPATTSARRYLENGIWRTMGRHWLAAAARALGVDRDRIAAWVRS
jgi:rSAM/selenodomain-associated transferase 2